MPIRHLNQENINTCAHTHRSHAHLQFPTICYATVTISFERKTQYQKDSRGRCFVSDIKKHYKKGQTLRNGMGQMVDKRLKVFRYQRLKTEWWNWRAENWRTNIVIADSRYRRKSQTVGIHKEARNDNQLNLLLMKWVQEFGQWHK